MWDIWWTQWDRYCFFSEYVSFSLSISFYQCSILVFIYLSSTLYCLNTDRIIKIPLHVYLFYWAAFVYLLLHSPSFRSHEANNLTHYQCMLCKARLTKLEVECGRRYQKVADACFRPRSPPSERFRHVSCTDLQKYNTEFLLPNCLKSSIWTLSKTISINVVYDNYHQIFCLGRVCLLAYCGWFISCVVVLPLQIEM